MVDALRRAHALLAPGGVVIDLHPGPEEADLLIGDRVAGVVESPAGIVRHQAAGEALASVVREGLFAVEDATAFEFYTQADSLEALRGHIMATWRDTAISEATLGRGRAMMADSAGGRPRARERVLIRRLRPR
jgi:hypothetical protein